MVKLIKKTIYYEGMPLRPLKVGKVSILTSRNLIKKFKNKSTLNKKENKMGKIIKTTLVRRASQLPKLKSTGYSIILGRNLVNKQKEKKEKKMAKIIWKGVAKKDDPIYG